jgi:hypothetical protein
MVSLCKKIYLLYNKVRHELNLLLRIPFFIKQSVYSLSIIHNVYICLLDSEYIIYLFITFVYWMVNMLYVCLFDVYVIYPRVYLFIGGCHLQLYCLPFFKQKYSVMYTYTILYIKICLQVL